MVPHMPTLFEIGTQIQELCQLPEDEGGDISERKAEIDACFASLDTERDQKLDAYAALITELEARASIREQEAMRLSHRAHVDADKARWLKKRMQLFFETLGLHSVDTPRLHIVLAGHGGKQPFIVHAAPDALPELFQKVRTEIKPDMEAIRIHLETMGPLRSAEGTLLAELGERGRSIIIR